MCVLEPPTEELGNRVLDAGLLDAVWRARGQPARVTALARELGPSHGLPHADHFHVPALTPYEPLRDDHGRLVAYVAAWVEPNVNSADTPVA